MSESSQHDQPIDWFSAVKAVVTHVYLYLKCERQGISPAVLTSA